MKSIQEVVRSKELEILKSIDDALLQKEAELRQLQKTLLEALRMVNRLLEVDSSAIDAALAEANAPARRSAAVASIGSATPSKTSAVEIMAKQFP